LLLKPPLLLNEKGIRSKPDPDLIMKTNYLFLRSLSIASLLMTSSGVSQATVIGFANLGGSNTDIASHLASNVTADGPGYTASNGTTPNIGLTWLDTNGTTNNWDVHTSTFFNPLENLTVGGTPWDIQADSPTTARVAQLDTGSQKIVFTVDAGYALVLNSFDFAETAETSGHTSWDVTLTNSNSAVVWSTSVVFNNNALIFAPQFTGVDGEDYTLTFNRTAQDYNSDGRHALDNLSFNQVAVPESGAPFLIGLGGLAFMIRRRG